MSTAYSLSKEDPNLKIIVLEKNSCGHERGSSYGESRMYRRMYSQAYFSQMQTDALKMWRQLEEVGKSICYFLKDRAVPSFKISMKLCLMFLKVDTLRVTTVLVGTLMCAHWDLM